MCKGYSKKVVSLGRGEIHSTLKTFRIGTDVKRNRCGSARSSFDYCRHLVEKNPRVKYPKPVTPDRCVKWFSRNLATFKQNHSQMLFFSRKLWVSRSPMALREKRIIMFKIIYPKKFS